MKKIWLTLLACLTFLCLAMGTSCSNLGGSKTSEEEGPKLVFNEMYLQEITLGDPIMLDEYIDPTLTEDYTLILTCDETGQERDLKMMGQWTTDKPGTYTLTYTVNSGEYAGTISTKIEVVVQKVTWQYSNPTLVYRAGDTMYFNVLKRNLNLLVKSYYKYEFFIESVSYNEQKEILKGMDSYTFPEEGTYSFAFGITTEDGQTLKAEQKINVRAQQVLAEGAEAWMEENNITVHDYTYVSPNGQVNLDGGYFNNSIVNDNVPYIAFNGEEGVGYGVGTYVMADFTGRNLPQVAFFCDEVTPSFTDGKSGVLVTNGITGNDGTDYYGTKLNMSRLTIFGPYKASFPEFDNRARMLATGSEADPFPISYHALSDTDQYRYIVGIQDASATHMTIRMLLINMTTLERVCDYTQKLTTSSGVGTLNLPDEYYKGSIVLYGRYGQKTKLDKVYLPIVDLGDIYDLDKAASFKSSYKTQYDLNATANVIDYIDIPEGEYEFKVFAPNGEEVAIDENGNFTYTMSGKYRLLFDPKKEGFRATAISVRVLYDLENELPDDYLELEGAIMGFDDWNFLTNTNKEYINEGSQSIEYYTINSKNGTITIYINKSFTDFIFLSRLVEGITFDVYTAKAVNYKISDQGRADKLYLDYTGEIPAETWTTLTVTREMCMANNEVYNDKSYALAIELKPEDKFYAREVIYIDNIQLKLKDSMPTISAGAKTFMEENNMVAYGYDAINDDMSASLYEGIYSGEWHKIQNDDVPYIAYQGNYGAGSYIVADFTGKNVPQLCFFVQHITSSLTDGQAGFYVHTGMVKKNGQAVSLHDGGRVTYFGPNKMAYARPDAEGRVGTQHGYKTKKDEASGETIVTEETSPLSINGLMDGVHYRYVIGIKSAQVGRFVVEQLLINLDTNEKVVSYETSITGDWITADYISGNIVMYGRYNYAITLDKIYAVYTNVSDIKAIDKVSEILG